jgi:ubiquinone/menaquinone biosynthesis C-methylase UbiE
MYFQVGYCTAERFASYACQINAVMQLGPRTVLEIGQGPGVVSHILRRANTKVVTLDHDMQLRPNVVGSVERLPFLGASFDVVLCCEVLEHVPYESFESALRQMRDITSKWVVLSVPNAARYVAMQIKIPHFRQKRWFCTVPWFARKHKFSGEHYWEIGKRGYPMRRIRQSIRASGFSIARDWRVEQQPQHHMFILEKSGEGKGACV